MKWKLFLTACASFLLISFPQNIISCGPGIDPYDYYTSFFHPGVADSKNYKPFYYTNNQFLYDSEEPVSQIKTLSKEWASYAGSSVSIADAQQFVIDFPRSDLSKLYYHIEKGTALQIPDSVKKNSLTSYFIRQKDVEALGYLMYAKQVQPFVIGDGWEPINRDSASMGKMIKSGQQLYAAARKDIFRLKYAYQIIRLAHYSNRFSEAIRFYDDMVVNNHTPSVLQAMCLSLKAGALLRTGKDKEAAYLFSKAFAMDGVKRVSNYLSFDWSVDVRRNKDEYLAFCKNDGERANMMALFALGSSADESAAINEIFTLDPQNKVLEVLAIREINKLEDVYYTPYLDKQKGGKTFYFTWVESSDSASVAGEKRVNKLKAILHTIAAKNQSTNGGLYETGAAYCALMERDYKASASYLENASKMNLSSSVKDQWSLTNLLLTINRKDKIDAEFEEQIVPSIKWLQQKATADTPAKGEYFETSQWKNFYRNMMSQVIAKRYHQQGDIFKEVLAIGAADKIYGKREYYDYRYALDYLHNLLESKDVEKLYALMKKKDKNGFEQYLVNFNSLTLNDVVDFAGTAYLRDYDYAKSIEWFGKSPLESKYAIKTNPFIDLLYDQEEASSTEKKTTTKVAFATEMLLLEKLIQTDKVNASKHFYKMALGLYNMTYYGHAWKLVQYERSGSDGYAIPDGANSFQKEYYGCFKAQNYFKQAMETSNDKNFKARCLFMIAKCAQKQVRRPQYDDFPGVYDYEKYEAAQKKYNSLFMNNQYFPALKAQYANTPFFAEATSRCSYLADFVKRK